jgi:hypothetical protein
MNRRRLEPIFLNDTIRSLELNAGLKSPSDVMLDIVRRNIADGSRGQPISG